jgi:predicted DNA-binding protein (UPF0251 family)
MKPRMVRAELPATRFVPACAGNTKPPIRSPVVLTPDELEALRLVDYEGLLQEEAARRMGVSRGTVWRCLDSARRKVGAMLVEGRELIISHAESPESADTT